MIFMSSLPERHQLWWLHAATAAMLLHGTAIFAAQDLQSIDGRVLDANGRPAIARVAIFNSERLRLSQCRHADECFERLIAAGAARAVSTSEANGRFVLRVPGGLRWDDTVWAEGTDASGHGIRTFWPVSPNRALPTSTLGDIQLNQRLDFFVAVKSEGQPVAGAEVDFGNGEVLHTDASGTVSRHMQVAALGPDSSGWHMAFTVRAEGFAAEEWANGVPAGTTTHVVELVPESVQAGRILDPAGQPIAHATVTAVPDAVSAVTIHASGNRPPDRTAGSARTDATGAFALHGLRAGRQYRLIISTDQSGVSNVERSITAGGGPMNIVMGAALPLAVGQGERPLQHPTAAQLHDAMQRLNWMIGRWEGSGWVESAPLGRREFSYSLHVRPELDGLLLIVDGAGYSVADKSVSYAEQLLISGPPPAVVLGPPGTYLWQESGRGVYLRGNEAQGTIRSLQVGLPLLREDCDWIVDEARRTWCRNGGEHVWSRATISLNDDNEWVQTREWQVQPSDDQSWHTYFKVVLRRVGQASP